MQSDWKGEETETERAGEDIYLKLYRFLRMVTLLRLPFTPMTRCVFYSSN